MDARGFVNLCGKLSLGTLIDTPLHDIWNAAEANEFRRHVDTDRGPCMTCDYRQRCLSPSMSFLDNHFTEELVATLSPDTRHAIRYDRTISDEEARWLFVRDVGRRVGIFDIGGGGKAWTARRVIPLDSPGQYRFSDPLSSDSRHGLHDKMRRDADSGLYVQLLETYGMYNIVKYHDRYWALPLALGPLNITRQPDREKPGILNACTLRELKELCGPLYSAPVLLETLPPYNLVAWKDRFWAIPLAFGPYDITQSENQSREGVRVADSMELLRRDCAQFRVLASQ